MSNLIDIMNAPLLAIWGDEVRARRIQGEHITLAMVELEAGTAVPEHRHANEQLGMVLAGEVDFTLDGETRTLGPGGTWRILANLPHNVTAGPNGAVVIDVSTPVWSDWDDLPIIDETEARQPATDD
ncbi:MAG: cupin domain-containing protein [Candidatus Limnocylindrales bacterium]